jgi:predicted nucleotidyltransferase
MYILHHTTSDELSLEQVIAALSASPLVDGVALFGSRVAAHDNPISDYDLLLLVTDLPVPIFQMFTHIGGRMADLVFADTASADRSLTLHEPIPANTFDALLLQ